MSLKKIQIGSQTINLNSLTIISSVDSKMMDRFLMKIPEKVFNESVIKNFNILKTENFKGHWWFFGYMFSRSIPSQILDANICVEYVSRNNNLVVFTYSDFFVKQINTCIMKFEKDKNLKKKKFDESEKISYKKVLAFFVCSNIIL